MLLPVVLLKPFYLVPRFLLGYIQTLSRAVIYRLLSVVKFPRIFGGYNQTAEQLEDSTGTHTHERISFSVRPQTLLQNCTNCVKVRLSKTVTILCWPINKVFTESSVDIITNKDESDNSIHEERENPELIHEFIINKVTTYIYNFSNLIWKRKLPSDDKKKRVRFPDGLTTPKIKLLREHKRFIVWIFLSTK